MTFELDLVKYAKENNIPLHTGRQRAEGTMKLCAEVLRERTGNTEFHQRIIHEGQFGWKYDAWKLFDYTSMDDLREELGLQAAPFIEFIPVFLTWNMYHIPTNRKIILERLQDEQ